jgi:hypothetical protein
MKLPRPYIKLSTRCVVARRQLVEGGQIWRQRQPRESLSEYLEFLLFRLRLQLTTSIDAPLQLDHDPALENRVKIFDNDGRITGYIPGANSSKHLVYRLVDEHLQKTTGRRPGATKTVTSKGSDNWLAKKFRRLEGPSRPKQKIPSRPFRRAK